MIKNIPYRKIIFLWLLWAFILCGFQIYSTWRMVPQRPDYGLSWTAGETRDEDQFRVPYLSDPLMNEHVAWDSEYYLSIAMFGYNDPVMRAIPENYTWAAPVVSTNAVHPDWISMNYAFFPLYPILINIFSKPLMILGLPLLATSTLAGILVSLLGTLAAMIAIYDIARDQLEESGAMRAVFYLLIWPASMFLAQVYTEGLFLGLSYGAIALAKRDKWIPAAFLAAAATWTRASGALLLLPMCFYWWQNGNLKSIIHHPNWKKGVRIILAISPIVAYFVWNALFGYQFHIIESNFFGRHLLAFQQTWHDIQFNVLPSLSDGNLQSRAYYLLEWFGMLFGLGASFAMLKRYPGIAVYSLALIIFSLTSGAMQGMHRYVMGAPVIFLLPALWGKNEVFDRTWSLATILMMGILAMVFSFNFFAG
jgi:hypothetical protein